MRRDGELFSTPAPQGFLEQNPGVLAHTASPAENLQNWAVVAAEVEVLLAGVPHGGRDAKIAAAAKRHEYNPYYVRRTLACLKFARSLMKHDLDLRSKPLVAVETLKRWADVDFENAVSAAERFLKGEFKLTEIQEKERSARRLLGKGSKSPVFIKIFKDLLIKEARKDYKDHQINSKLSGALKPFLELVGKNTEDSERVAIVAVGPFHSNKVTSKQIDEKIKECLSFMCMYNEVIAAFSSEDVEKAFVDTFTKLPVRVGNLKYWSFDPDDYSPNEPLPAVANA